MRLYRMPVSGCLQIMFKDSIRIWILHIPYKVRAALLLVPLNTPMPTGAVTQSLWYIAVRSGDVHRVQHYLRTERDT